MNTNYIIPQSKLTPHQISAFNKLNPYSFLEKDYSIDRIELDEYKNIYIYFNFSELNIVKEHIGQENV